MQIQNIIIDQEFGPGINTTPEQQTIFQLHPIDVVPGQSIIPNLSPDPNNRHCTANPVIIPHLLAVP